MIKTNKESMLLLFIMLIKALIIENIQVSLSLLPLLSYYPPSF